MNLNGRHVQLLFLMSLGMMGMSIVLLLEARTPQAVPVAPQTPEPIVERTVTPRGDLAAAEESTIALFDAAAPSVVFITTMAHVPVRRGLFGRTSIRRLEQGSGSGFIWDRAGHIVTNFHVIAEAESAVVRTADGQEFDAALVGTAPDQDLAVLRIDAPEGSLTPLAIGSSRSLRVGQTAIAIGNPFGLDHTLTTGVISALDREMEAVSGRTIYGAIQTDAAINPGNSGGPLLDSAGRLIGVNTAIRSPSGAYAGIGFAVPVDTVNRIIPQLIRTGRAPRPGLGIQLAHPQTAQQLGVEGAVVLGIFPGSAAEAVGMLAAHRDRRGRIHVGDVIVSLDDAPIRAADDLIWLLDAKRLGDEVQLGIIRHGAERSVKVKLQAID